MDLSKEELRDEFQFQSVVNQKKKVERAFGKAWQHQASRV